MTSKTVYKFERLTEAEAKTARRLFPRLRMTRKAGGYEVSLSAEQRDKLYLALALDDTGAGLRGRINSSRKADKVFNALDSGSKNSRGYICR